jgi:hypothetical protein
LKPYEEDADFLYPEHTLGPYEQMKMIDEHIETFKSSNITMLTMSPYILNYLNVKFASKDLEDNDIDIFFIDNESDNKWSLKAKDENGNLIVDTYDFSEPMNQMLNLWLSYNKNK